MCGVWSCETGRVDDKDLLASLLSDVEATAGLLETAPGASVVHCPGWTVEDLVGHHGGVLRWAEAIVQAGKPVFEQHPPPDDRDRLGRWYIEAAQRFASTVSGLDRDRACWTFGRPPECVWFWIRRQALEAAIHCWDAKLATGADHEVRSDLASLGITEVVEDLFPRQLALGRSPALSRTTVIRAVDTDQDWQVGPTDGDPESSAVEASAALLLLLLWRRIDVDDPRVCFNHAVVKDEWALARFTP